MVATNAVRFHTPDRRPLADVLTCIREKVTLDQAGHRLEANAERCLKPPAEMLRLFRGHEHAVARTVALADAIRFDLKELRYEYPDEPVPPGKTAQQHLADLTWNGARFFFPDGISAENDRLIRKELRIIERHGHRQVLPDRPRHRPLGQGPGHPVPGPGSAANSVVCYCLGITQ
jgi:error-prone DNA polymerase